jgi:hypothetical protein
MHKEEKMTQEQDKRDPISHPDVPDTPRPTEPEGQPDPPPVREEPDPYPVTDLPPEQDPDTEPVPIDDPPHPAYPGGVPNVGF